MYGKGIIKGLFVTLKHFFDTFFDDIRKGKKRYKTEEGVEYRRSKDVKGIFTVQYPEEKLPTPEEFRFIPFLIYDEMEDGSEQIRCTSCGICAKVCPPQCIWIEQTLNPKTGRPVPDPAEFYIDVDLCMNCGLCTEFCPFNAIKMDHDYEISVYDRLSNNIYGKDKLGKSLEYYASIRPLNHQAEIDAKLKAKKDFDEGQAEKAKRAMLQQ